MVGIDPLPLEKGKRKKIEYPDIKAVLKINNKFDYKELKESLLLN